MGGVLGIAAGLLTLYGVKFNIRSVSITVLALAVAVGIMILADSLRAGADQSHIIRAATHTSDIGNIIIRKASLNLYLLFHSPWSLSLIAAIFGLVTIRRNGRTLSIKDRSAWVCALFGAAGLFLFNDSGVVAAATCLLVWWGVCMAREVSLLTSAEPELSG